MYIFSALGQLLAVLLILWGLVRCSSLLRREEDDERYSYIPLLVTIPIPIIGVIGLAIWELNHKR